MIVIRPCRVAECPAVLALWQRAGAIPSPTDTLVELEQLVTYQDDGLLVAVENGVIVGSVIGGWDGWRETSTAWRSPRRRGVTARAPARRRCRARAERQGAHRISALVERTKPTPSASGIRSSIEGGAATNGCCATSRTWTLRPSAQPAASLAGLALQLDEELLVPDVRGTVITCA